MNKGQKESLEEIKKFLENYDYLKEEKTDNLRVVLKTQKQPIYIKDNVYVSMMESQGLDKNNNISYQLSININGILVFKSDVKPHSFSVSVFKDDLFIINEEVTCLPFDILCMSAIAKYPISTLKNALEAEKQMDDADDLIFDKDAIEKMVVEVQKYADKLDKNIANETFVQNCFMAILPTFCYPLLLNHEKGIITMSAISLAAIIYKICNNISTSYNTRLSVLSHAKLMTVQMEYDNIIEQLKSNKYETDSVFDKIINENYKTLLENKNLKLYVKETKGYVNNKIFYQTSLFVNDIEFWNSGLKNKSLPVVYSRYCIYIFDENITYIPLGYVINSILSDNPIEMLNNLLNDKVKVYER